MLKVLFQSISWFNQWCFVFIAFQQNYSLNAKRSLKRFFQIFVSEFLNRLGHTACFWHMLLHETKE